MKHVLLLFWTFFLFTIVSFVHGIFLTRPSFRKFILHNTKAPIQFIFKDSWIAMKRPCILLKLYPSPLYLRIIYAIQINIQLSKACCSCYKGPVPMLLTKSRSGTCSSIYNILYDYGSDLISFNGGFSTDHDDAAYKSNIDLITLCVTHQLWL